MDARWAASAMCEVHEQSTPDWNRLDAFIRVPVHVVILRRRDGGVDGAPSEATPSRGQHGAPVVHARGDGGWVAGPVDQWRSHRTAHPFVLVNTSLPKHPSTSRSRQSAPRRSSKPRYSRRWRCGRHARTGCRDPFAVAQLASVVQAPAFDGSGRKQHTAVAAVGVAADGDVGGVADSLHSSAPRREPQHVTSHPAVHARVALRRRSPRPTDALHRRRGPGVNAFRCRLSHSSN